MQVLFAEANPAGKNLHKFSSKHIVPILLKVELPWEAGPEWFSVNYLLINLSTYSHMVIVFLK